jgi:hypothetical protein
MSTVNNVIVSAFCAKVNILEMVKVLEAFVFDGKVLHG